MSPYRKFDATLLERKTLSSLSALLLDQITGGIYLYSRSRQQLLFHNKELENLTGISGNEFQKKHLQPFQELFFPDDLAMIQYRAYPCIKEVFNTKHNNIFSVFKYSMNYRIKTPAGRIRHLFHQTTVLELDQQNEPEILLAHISDISEYKKDSALLLVISGYDPEKKKWKKLFEQKFFHHPKQLSNREVSIMQMITAGQSQRDIALKLHISYFTVRAHCRHILEKTECRSIRDLKQKCLEEGWT